MVAAHVQLQGLWIFQDEYCCRSIPGYLTPFFLYINPSFMLLSFIPYISMYPYIYIYPIVFSLVLRRFYPPANKHVAIFLNSPSNVCWFLINFIKYIHSSLSLPHLLRWFTSKNGLPTGFFSWRYSNGWPALTPGTASRGWACWAAAALAPWSWWKRPSRAMCRSVGSGPLWLIMVNYI